MDITHYVCLKCFASSSELIDCLEKQGTDTPTAKATLLVGWPSEETCSNVYRKIARRIRVLPKKTARRFLKTAQ